MKFIITITFVFFPFLIFSQELKQVKIVSINENTFFYLIKLQDKDKANFNFEKFKILITSEFNCLDLKYLKANNEFSFITKKILIYEDIVNFFTANSIEIRVCNVFFEYLSNSYKEQNKSTDRKILIFSSLYPDDYPKFECSENAESDLKNFIRASKSWLDEHPEFRKNELNYEK